MSTELNKDLATIIVQSATMLRMTLEMAGDTFEGDTPREKIIAMMDLGKSLVPQLTQLPGGDVSSSDALNQFVEGAEFLLKEDDVPADLQETAAWIMANLDQDRPS